MGSFLSFWIAPSTLAMYILSFFLSKLNWGRKGLPHSLNLLPWNKWASWKPSNWRSLEVSFVQFSLSHFDFILISTKPINASTQGGKQGREEGTQPAFCLLFSQGAKLCYLCKSSSPPFLSRSQSSPVSDGAEPQHGGCLSWVGSGGGLLKLPQAELYVWNS